MADYFHPSKETFGKDSPDEKQKEIPQEELKVYKDEGVEHVTVAGLTSIIIPALFINYPIFHQTGNCIGSIREHTDENKTPYEIILVINGKTGIGFEEDKLADTYADKVIQNPENLGFAKAVNQAIRTSNGEYIAIINNDVQVFDNWLVDLQEALQHVDLIEATPMYGMPFARAVEAKELRDKTMQKPIEETLSSFRDFSCVLARKALFEEIGVFDEEFFMYGEDVDLVKRMEAVGKRDASTTRVNTHHIIGSTSQGMDETAELMTKAKERLKEKWGI